MSNSVSVIIPKELRNDAKNKGINISSLCRLAITDAVKKLEPKEAPTPTGRENMNGAEGEQFAYKRGDSVR